MVSRARGCACGKGEREEGRVEGEGGWPPRRPKNAQDSRLEAGPPASIPSSITPCAEDASGWPPTEEDGGRGPPPTHKPPLARPLSFKTAPPRAPVGIVQESPRLSLADA